MQSLKPSVIFTALGTTLLLFIGFGWLGISAQYLYGGIGGLNRYPHQPLIMFIGGLLGRYVLAKRFGRERWQNYAPILVVGFGAGMGLSSMIAIAINFLWTSIGSGY
jgi:hypothetical protein